MFSFVLKPKCNLENVSVANPGVVGGGREKERGGEGAGVAEGQAHGRKSSDVVPLGLSIPWLAGPGWAFSPPVSPHLENGAA